MIWVYAICDRPDLPAPRSRGLAQAPLEGVSEGAVSAVFSRHAHALGEPAPDALWAHERVVEELMRERAVLPMRFGSRLEDEAALRALLADEQERFLDVLARVSGRVELGVRALQTAGPSRTPVATAAATGRDYLMDKLETGRRADHAAAELHAPLEALADEALRHPARGDDEVLRGAYLVDQRIVASFQGAVEGLQRSHPGVAILCTGPWPPYSFVN